MEQDINDSGNSLMEMRERISSERTIAELYSENGILRALVQMVPVVGPMIDATTALPGTRIKEKRLIQFILLLYESLIAVQSKISNIEISNSEEFYDIFESALESSLKSRSKEKLVFNIMILTNVLCVKNKKNYRPEEYLKALSVLTPIEIKILSIFYDAYANDIFQSDEEENELQKAQRIMAQERVKKELQIDNADEVTFHLLRLERSGLVREITGTYWDYGGGRFTITDVLIQLMEYLSNHPFAKIDIEKLFGSGFDEGL